MKVITKFCADDGREFATEIECLDYESLCDEIAVLMKPLPPSNIEGDGFIQQDGALVLTIQRRLVMIYERLHSKDKHTEWARNAIVPAGMTLIGRYIDDSDCRPLHKAWYRLQCMDQKFREYSQPYYAILADKAA